MDKNKIDIKIREFAIYLKDFGLLNDSNIKDFLKTFKNINEKDSISSKNYNNDINLDLIYLKENLSKAMVEFFNLMTEEKKRIIYLNVYSNFLQKRIKELNLKGIFIYKVYCCLIIKKYFFKWKDFISNYSIKNKENNNIQKLDKFKDLQYDNFSFDIISDNNASNINNNLIINSNNHKILFNTNANSKIENRSTINSYTDINPLILSTKSTIINNNNNVILNQNNFKNKLSQENKESKKYNTQMISNENQNSIIYENFEHQKNKNRKAIGKQNNRVNKSQVHTQLNTKLEVKNRNKSNKNYEVNSLKRKKSFIKLIEKDNFNLNENNIQTNRKIYNSNRPVGEFNYNEYNKKNVYKRLYEQNIEYNKRKEQRIEENLKQITERCNHPIIRSNSINKFKSIKKNIENKENTKNNFEKNFSNRNSSNNFKKQKISKSIYNTIENHNFIYEKEYRYTAYDKNYKNKEENDKNNKENNFMENQKKCIELFNEIIKNKEIKMKKNLNEEEKENILKDLLNKIYKENIYHKNLELNFIEDLNMVKGTEY